MATENRIRLFLDGLASPACVVSADLAVLYANYDFFEMAQISQKEIRRAVPITQCVNLDVFAKTKNVVEEVVRTGTKLKLREVHGTNAAGEPLSLCLSVLPTSLLADDGDSAILVFSDLTHEEQVQQKYKALYEKELRERRKLEEFNIRLNELVEERTRELQKAYAEIDEELQVARKVQDGLLPRKLPEVIGLNVAAEYIPAGGRVGGDLYDVIVTPDHRPALLIFDVSGHGVPSALIGAMAKMLFTYYIMKGGTPAQVLSSLNQELVRFVKTGHYLTAFLGIVDTANRSMVYSLAGHPRPIFYRSRTGETTELVGQGTLIGHPALVDIAEYDDNVIRLEPEDKLLLYTDGLTEAMNPREDMYGADRLMDLARKWSDLTPTAFIAKILADNEVFREGCELRDDFTVLSVEFGRTGQLLQEAGFRTHDLPSVLTITSAEEIEGVCSTILKQLDDRGYPNGMFFKVHLVIREMLMNAIQHGNKHSPNKKVTVLHEVGLDQLVVTVIDEGQGFSPGIIPDPLDPENLRKANGRGLFYIRNYMDEVKFNETGNMITAIKRWQKGN